MTKKMKYSVGDILLCKSFAGPVVRKRVLKKINRPSGFKKDKESGIRIVGFEGCFTRKSDMMKLKEACVPYSSKDKPSKCVSFTYDWQIIKVIHRSTKHE